MAKKKKKYQSGGEIKEVKQFYTDYLNSTNYKKRLKLQGYSDPSKTTANRLSNLDDFSISYTAGIGNKYTSSNNNVNFDSLENKKHNFNQQTTAAHEISHALGSLGFTNMG